MKFHVTQDDIARGVPGEPCDCPVARCVRRTLLGPDGRGSLRRRFYVRVDDGEIQIRLRDEYCTPVRRWDVPAVVERFIGDFDDDPRGGHGSFNFTLPDWITDL